MISRQVARNWRGCREAGSRRRAQMWLSVITRIAKPAQRKWNWKRRKHSTLGWNVCRRADLGNITDAKKLIDFAGTLTGTKLTCWWPTLAIWNAEDAPIEKLTEEAMGRNAAREFEKRLCGDSFCVGNKDDRAEERENYRDQFDGGTARRSVSRALCGVKGRGDQHGEGPSKTELAPRHNILVNCVAPGWVKDTDIPASAASRETGAKFRDGGDSGQARGHSRRNCRADSFIRALGPATIISGEVLNVNGGAVLCG